MTTLNTFSVLIILSLSIVQCSRLKSQITYHQIQIFRELLTNLTKTLAQIKRAVYDFLVRLLTITTGRFS